MESGLNDYVDSCSSVSDSIVLNILVNQNTADKGEYSYENASSLIDL